MTTHQPHDGWMLNAADEIVRRNLTSRMEVERIIRRHFESPLTLPSSCYACRAHRLDLQPTEMADEGVEHLCPLCRAQLGIL